MGEARRRGTFEQRKVAAIKRDADILREQKPTIVTEKQTMTPKERMKKELYLSTLYATLMGNGALMPLHTRLIPPIKKPGI
jgi:hypothetical protein